MNILHIVENYTFKSGGLRVAVSNLNHSLNSVQGVHSYVLSNVCEINDDVILTKKSFKLWLYTPNFHNLLKEICSTKKIDVIHIHGVWMYLQYGAANFAIKNNIPFILSSHGMYEPWYWKKGRLKKLLYFKLVSKYFFNQSTIHHAITYLEAANLKKFFPNKNIQLIPNLIYFENNGNNEEINFKTKYILSLGRIHPVKGIELIINSLHLIDRKDITLKIAGDYNTYQKKLSELVVRKGLQNRIEFLGMISGNKKEELYKNAFLFVSPSRAEAIGIVNLEAARFKTPVITSYNTGLDKGWASNGGMLINPNENELTEALNTALSWTEEERNYNGQKLFNFVKKNYSWEERIIDWIKLYKQIIEKSL